MKAGISTATLFRRVHTEEALSLFENWKVGEAEVFLTSFCEYKEGFAKELLSRKGGVHIHSVHVLGTQFEPQLFSAHSRVRRDAYEILESVMQSASLIGAEHYTFHGFTRAKRTFKEDIPRTGEGTQRLFEFCESYNVALCFENVEWAFYNRPGIFSQLKEYCPRLGGVLDIKQARLSGYPYEKYLEDIGSALTHVHVSDVDGQGKMCLPGKGVFDYDALLSRLAGAGFQGPVIIENYASDFGDLSELKASYEFLAEKAEKYSK